MTVMQKTVLGLVSTLALTGCGGNVSSTPAASGSGSAMSGTVAVGAPITSGTLRILDATGTEVASGIAIDADGRYQVPTLTGTAPYRIEACGYAGPNYQCIYSAAQGPGQVNVTPLTTAMVLLASNQTPTQLMAGASTVLDSAAVAAAQAQLRTGLAGVLSGNVEAGFDFVGGTLSAGSRTGYDKVLDSIGVSTGVDTQPFVQITPRQGTGNLYLEQGSSDGTITPAGAASSLSLESLETLFRNMTTAIGSAQACSTGMAPLLASTVQLSLDDESAPASGPADVSASLCQFFAGGNASATWGARFLSPTLGRCDFSGVVPVCRVSFVIQSVDGGVHPVGEGMAVAFESNAWKFKGQASAVAIRASARAQRDRRIDAGSVVDAYSRALAFEVPALAGLACAKVSQRNPAGTLVTVAYYKRYTGVDGPPRRLSAWRSNQAGESRSTDPAVGEIRTGDDSWLMLPQGVDGDDVVRNFFRGGRTVTVSLYGDTLCTTAFTVSGQSEFDIDVEGVPPLWSAMPSMPWPELSDASKTSLAGVTLGTSAGSEFAASWSFSRGVLGLNDITFCGDRASCGEDGPGRLGARDIAAAATSTVLTLHTGPSTSLTTGSHRMLSLSGRTGDGIGMQSNFLSCAEVSTGLACQN
jgi:hypothetical protein